MASPGLLGGSDSWKIYLFLMFLETGTRSKHQQVKLSCVMMTSTYARDKNCVLTERGEEGQAGETLQGTSSMGRSPLTKGNLLDLGDG